MILEILSNPHDSVGSTLWLSFKIERSGFFSHFSSDSADEQLHLGIIPLFVQLSC